MSNSDTYMFMSQPRAVDAARKKYRETEDVEGFDNTANLMFDPRVIRGITMSGPTGTVVMEEKENTSQQLYNAKLRKEQLLATGKIRPTLDSVAEIHEKIVVPKVRVEVPLHLYLLEQEETISTIDQDTQTDVFLEESPAPKFIPKKTGVDVDTQVENEQVFDYDVDVMPILQVVISKTVEQSLMEVRQEEQLRTVSRKREHLEEKARVRGEEAAQLEKDEKAALRAKEQLLMEGRQRHKRSLEVQKKIASNVFAGRYLANLEKAVFDDLAVERYFYNTTEFRVQQFTPWLHAKIAENLKGVKNSAALTDTLLRKTLVRIEEQAREERDRKAAIEAARQAAIAEAARQAQEAIDRAAKIELYIHTDITEEPVGPIILTGNSTVLEVKEKILEWMSENMDSPPAEETLSFVYNGGSLDAESVLYDIGMETLSTIQMVVNNPREGDEGEGDGDGEGD